MSRTGRRTTSPAPGLSHERSLWEQGQAVVAGVDEVGRGAWAGPLTLAMVVVPQDRRINRVRDSKMLAPAERETLFDRILDWADAVSVAHASPAECDELGMSAAQKLAARRCLDGLGIEVDHVLVDGPWDFVEQRPVTTLVKGDQISLSIAAASVVAKVTRDRMMGHWAEVFPGFGFADNKGYPCPRHQATLARTGPCAIHRQSWSFMDDLRWTGLSRHQPDAVSQPGLF